MQTDNPDLGTILLADDDIDDREFFQDALKAVSSNVILKMAENGIEVMDSLHKDESLPDLIFLDLNMPLMNGYECLSDIKGDDKFKHIPVIIFSTSLQQEAVNEMYKCGASFYIVKPNSFSDLKALLRKVFVLNWKNPESVKKESFIFQI